MRGHQPLIAARRQGFVPASVWLYDLDSPRQSQRFAWPAFGSCAGVDIEPDDSPRRLDLRFVVGLTVHLLSHDAERLKAITHQAVEGGAKRVISSLMAGHGDAARCVAINDTEGAFEWRA